MRITSLICLLCGLTGALIADSAAARSEGELAAGMVNPGYQDKPDWFRESFLDIREDIAEASDDGRRLMLYFYQDGCPYCALLLQDNFGQAEIAQQTQRYFNTIAINLWGDREVTDLDGEFTTEKDFARDLRVQFTPTLLMLDERGDVVLRINGYYPPHRFIAALDWVGQRLEGERDFRAHIAKTAPPAASGELHGGPGYLDLGAADALAARDAGKPLLIFFEQRKCRACDELHSDILQRPESRELLAGFDRAVVDIWGREAVATPDGRHLPARQWARELGVAYAPSLLFFDTGGREIFRTEAYLKAFHLQTAMDYVASGAWREQPEFQRFVDQRADALRAQGIEVELMH